MKYSTLALALTSILSVGAASAATVMKADNGDFLKVYGGAEIGGTFVSDTDKTPFGHDGRALDGSYSYDSIGNDKRFVNDSFLTLGAKGQTGDIYFKFELDAEHTDWMPENSMHLVIDKAYVGYKLSKTQSIEAGRTDTAYDHYDAFGDYTNELAAGVSEAGDQDETLKYQAQYGDIKVGISHSLEGFDEEHNGKGDYITDSREGKVTNGYVGYFTKGFTVLAAAETVDDRGEIYSIHGEVKLDKLSIGGFASISDRRDGDKSKAKKKDTNTYVLSTKYKLTDKLSLIAAANMVTSEATGKDDATWGVIGTEYKYARNIKLAAEVSMGDVLAKGESGTLGYVKAYYWF
jgi:hypothetical protein